MDLKHLTKNGSESFDEGLQEHRKGDIRMLPEEMQKLIQKSIGMEKKAVLDMFAMECQYKLDKARPEIDRMKKEIKEEMNKYEAGSEKRREIKKAGDASLKKYLDDNDPFYSRLNLAYEISKNWSDKKNKDLNHPQADVSASVDAVDFPIEEKLELLYIMRENAKENLYPGALEVTGEADKKRTMQMAAFQERFGIGQLVTNDGDGMQPASQEIKGDIFEHNYGDMTNCFMLMFSSRYSGLNNQNLMKRNISKDIQDFCEQKITEYHMMLMTGDLKNQKSNGNSPYFAGPGFKRTQQQYRELQAAQEATSAFVGSGGEKGAQTTALEKASLLGRGSTKFDAMKNAYQDLQKIILEHKKKPTAETYRKLAEQAKIVDEKADAYLQMKYKEIDSGKTKGSKMPDEKGGFVYQAQNSRTQKRMDSALGLKEELRKLNQYVEKNMPKEKKTEKSVEGNVLS